MTHTSDTKTQDITKKDTRDPRSFAVSRFLVIVVMTMMLMISCLRAHEDDSHESVTEPQIAARAYP